MRPVTLETVRPMVIGAVSLSENNVAVGDTDAVDELLASKVKEMIATAVSNASGTRAPLPPLVRLKVEFSGGYATTAPARFGQRFVGQVANADDILLYFKKKTMTGGAQVTGGDVGCCVRAHHTARSRSETKCRIVTKCHW
jgi:double-strand break repair protein MRE11